MLILTANEWEEYDLLDSGNGYRLERFGPYTIKRPDPQAIWKQKLNQSEWDKADASFLKTGGSERWVFRKQIPERWLLKYKNLSFFAKLTPFKHTGIFPEQAANWDWMSQKIQDAHKQINILNLFAYTGIASLATASSGAKVTHLDASRPSIGWARENQAASGLQDKPIRWILDDALKFTAREIKRGVKYDGIILDPPVYGHGPRGERWDFSKDLPKLIDNCRQILTEKPLFLLINAYAVSASALMLENVIKDYLGNFSGKTEFGELALKEKSGGRLLSTGIFARWSSL